MLSNSTTKKLLLILKQLPTYVNRVQYTVAKAVLFWPSSLRGVLCIKYSIVQN